MIKPLWRKRCGITALLCVNLALAYSLYTQQETIAKTALYVDCFVILAWYVSEGFIEKLISKKMELEIKNGNK